jgi:hypothetical protein
MSVPTARKYLRAAKLEFIHHTNTQNILTRFDETLVNPPGNRRIIPFIGYEGTGKSYLFQYWATQHLRKTRGVALELAPVVRVEVRDTERATIDRKVYVTPITCNLFSEIVFQLGEITERLGKPTGHNAWYMPTGKLYSDSQFNALYNFVRREFKSVQARALVIDRADRLDACAFEMLLRWYEYRKRQFALLLCFTMPKNGSGAETLRTMYRIVPQALLEDPIELPRLDRKEFAERVLPALLEDLKVQWPEQYAEQLQLAKRAWQTTNGDWKSIEYMVMKFRRAIATRRGRTRELTPEVLKEVFGSWD